jgi:arsenate reductase
VAGMTTIYGIPNCDTMKKARAWLGTQGIEHAFHDYRKAGVPAERVRAWVERLGWEVVLNRRGTSFSALPEEARSDLNAVRAIAIMLAHPSTIKRPVVESGDELLVGFDPDAWARALC